MSLLYRREKEYLVKGKVLIDTTLPNIGDRWKELKLPIAKDPKKVGHVILRNIVDGGYKGRIFVVNPNAGEIAGFKSYPSVLSVKYKIDMAGGISWECGADLSAATIKKDRNFKYLCQ